VPSLEELSADYHAQLKDGRPGTVMLYGRPHRVTHPITSFGLEHFIAPEAQ
jgi:hypothetical protein